MSLHSGTLNAGKYTCAGCKAKADHSQLQTGVARRLLIAVEETSTASRRRIRAPDRRDLAGISLGSRYVRAHENELDYPTCELSTDRRDARPISFGIKTANQLFTERQLAVFGAAFRWLRDQRLPPAVERAMRLALSNALTTNNRLCSYARDYGRLAPLFSVRSYSLPWLAVELNPLHPDAGRGTLAKIFSRMERSTTKTVRRYVWSTTKRKAVATDMEFTRLAQPPDVRCASALEQIIGMPAIDLCLFDPPYFDYIAYSELSEFYRVWDSDQTLGGTPLLPDPKEPTRSFGRDLAICLRQVLGLLKAGRLLAFTFHASSESAWEAIALAIELAELKVTAIWPILNDAHMGHHAADGNCEWDLVVVCRRASDCAPAEFDNSIKTWAQAVRPLKIRRPDRRYMNIAIATLSKHYGKAKPTEEQR